MKIFQSLRKQFGILGITPSNQLNQKYPLNKRILFGFFILNCSVISELVYTLCVANGFLECVDSICDAFGSIVAVICFAAMALRKSTIFKVIENIENLIDTSKTIARLINNFIDNGDF